MTYENPYGDTRGFPVQTDGFGNDPGIGVDGPGEWKRELPPFGPALVPFIDGRITDLERSVQKLIDKWSYKSVTVVNFSTMQADSSGNIDTPQTPNAILYESPAGFTYAMHRLVIAVPGHTFGEPYTAAASYWELRRGGSMVYGASIVSGVGSLPVIKEWGTRDAPRARAGESFTLFVAGGNALAGVQVQVGTQGTLDRTEEG